ncbi:arabinosyltransferase domain-containing protein [Geodermatophilus sp. SYSU D00525]
MGVVERSPVGSVPADVPARPPRRPLPWLLALALVAVLGALLLPLAPVQMSVPTVTWPQDPARPQSTMLQLTGQRPLALDVRFSCAAVTAAAAGDGLVLSTIVPAQPAAGTEGLLVTASDDRLRVLVRGSELLDVPVPSGDCTHRLTGDAGGLRLTRDGAELATVRAAGDATVLPDVDVLDTGLTRLPTDDDLRVTLTVDDQFDTTPTPLKGALVAAVVLAAAGSLLALARADRRRGPGPPALRTPARPGWRPRAVRVAVDAAVVATALLWLFLAPDSDDDGYYSAMARNADDEGYVGNYYQLNNQSFTPFTWSYRLLGWWQHLGDAPVVLRVPSLVAGLVTWFLLRRLTTRPGALPGPVAASAWGPAGVQVLLAAAFLAWWLPYGVGVRPEAVVGVLALATLTGVLSGLRRRRLLPVALAVGTAGLGVACHPTGFVALAPLVAALPRLAALVAEGRTRAEVVTRTAQLLAPGAFAAVAAFADGTLRDFVRGQEIFLAAQDQSSWYDEWQRYAFLFSDIPMGAYARRGAVVLALAALPWALVVLVAARGRDVRVPLALGLSTATFGAALLLLWLTPSKWTHHFGALSGLGPAWLALFLGSLPWLVRSLARHRAPRAGVLLAGLGTVVVAAALALHGPNSWPYTWLPGMPQANEAPSVGPVALGSLLTWSVVAAAVLGAAVLRHRRGTGLPGPWWAGTPPVLAGLALGTSVAYLVTTSAVAAAADTWSPQSDALTDPLATRCSAAQAVEVLDVTAARPLAPDPDAPPPEGPADLTVDGGWFPPDPPPAAAGRVWGSLTTTGPAGEYTVGEQVTPWYRLPATADGEEVAVLAAGRLTGGNELRVEYARAGGGPLEVADGAVLSDPLDSARWRTFVLDPPDVRDGGELLVRLVGRDRSGGPGGWLAFSGPSVLPRVPLTDLVPDGAPVALGWQFAFRFPCQRQPVVSSGITEPVEYAVLWRDGPGVDGLGDAAWQTSRGSLFGPAGRTSGITDLDAVLPGTPEVDAVQVLLLDVPHPVDAYDLTRSRVVRAGWAAPPE